MTAEARAAAKFVEFWTYQRGSEKGEDQKFWNSLLSDVLGVADVTTFIQYQVPVHAGGSTKFLDAWIPSTRVLIEHKTRGVDLSARARELEVSVKAGRVVGALYDALLERYGGIIE